MKSLKTKSLKILVLRYRFIGDTLLMIPFLRALRQAYPDATIDVLVSSGSGELLEDLPEVNQLIFYDQQPFWRMAQELRARGYHKAYVLKRSFSSALLAFCAGIPERVGFKTEYRSGLLTQSVAYNMNRHEADCFLDVLRAEGLPVAKTAYQNNQLCCTVDFAGLNTPAFSEKQHWLLHLTSSNSAKQWPLTHWSQLAQKLLAASPTIQLHTVGTMADHSMAEALRASLPQAEEHRLSNWCGQTTLKQSLGLLKHMTAVIGCDSGTLHLAAALGLPIFALFGPMSEAKWRPLSSQTTVLAQHLPCRPCNLKVRCPHAFVCMTDLSVETAWQPVSRFLQEEAAL